MKKEKGIALVTILILVLFFSIMGVAMMILSRRDVVESQRNRKLQMALSAAEAGIDRAIWQLDKGNLTLAGLTTPQVLGTYPDTTSFVCSVDTTPLQPNRYEITCTGTATGVMKSVYGGKGSEVRRRLKAFVELSPPKKVKGENYALFTNGNLHLQGQAHGIDGDGLGRVNYCTTSGSPLQTTEVPEITNVCQCPKIDTPTLRALAQTQGTRFVGNIRVHQNQFKPPNKPVPTKFWNNPPTNTIPNVIYIEGNLEAIGGHNLYGLYIVLGNVTLGGNVTVHGAIYATGQVTWSHGTPKINGTVFGCGGAIRLSGNPQINYKAEYAKELGKHLGDINIPGGGTKLLSYQDISY